MSAFAGTRIVLHFYFYTHSPSTLHHLIASDVLIAAASQFDWASSLLHHGVVITPTARACRW